MHTAGNETQRERLPRQQRNPQDELQNALRTLVQRAAGSLVRLDDHDLDQLGRLHRALSTHLALLRGLGGSARRIDEMNHLLGQSHGLLYGRARGPRHGRFVRQLRAFPETVRRTIAYHGLAALLLIAGGVYGFFGAGTDPEWALGYVMAGDERTPYATTEELAASLSSGRPDSDQPLDGARKAAFAAWLWSNNTRVALLAFFLGAAAGIPTMLVVLYNGALLGVYTRTFHDRGLAKEWWAWILPHGITELLAIVLLAGGGLWIGRLVVAPGEVGRGQALRAARPHVLRLVLFAFPMLLLAALIESFVRQSGLGDAARYWFAAGTAGLWLLYLGLVRRSPADLVAETVGSTLLERVVPLPADAEMMPASFTARRAAGPRGSG